MPVSYPVCGAALVFLTIFSVYDLRTKHLPLSFLAVAGLFSAGYSFRIIFTGQSGIIPVLLTFTPGLSVLLLSTVFPDSVGSADGLCIAFLGTVTGSIGILVVLLLASLLTFITAVLLLLLRRAGKKSKIPFIPFLEAGFLIRIFLLR